MSNYLGTPAQSGITIVFTSQKKELFDFAQDYSGKMASFCIRYENAQSDLVPRFQVLFRKGKVV
jgi:hypothetical protein